MMLFPSSFRPFTSHFVLFGFFIISISKLQLFDSLESHQMVFLPLLPVWMFIHIYGWFLLLWLIQSYPWWDSLCPLLSTALPTVALLFHYYYYAHFFVAHRLLLANVFYPSPFFILPLSLTLCNLRGAILFALSVWRAYVL